MRLEKNFDHFSNKKVLDSFYRSNHYKSFLEENFLENRGLEKIAEWTRASANHGLNPENYNCRRLDSLLGAFHQHPFHDLIHAYIALADLELNSMNSLISYSRDLQYGRLNPKQVYTSQFNIRYKTPDSTFLSGIFHCKNLQIYLDSIQPKKEAYTLMEKDLSRWVKAHPENWSGQDPQVDSILKLRVNMERLRWKPFDSSSHYLLVNIPEFKLYAIENNIPVWDMKVCVGQRKKEDYNSRMALYLKTHKIDDRPENHQTPLLYSVIQSIQVNPKWSVPKSIIQNEIFYKMIRNPKYLQENQMKLYIGNKLISRPDTIHWNKIPRDKIPFNIKQDAGDFNSLGKLKFNFQNPFSVYLHDTPSKGPFKWNIRDVSHGCVRVENPLKLASYLLEGNGKNAMDLVRIKIGLKPGDDSSEHLQRLYQKEQESLSKNQHTFESSAVLLKRKVPIYIQYFTSGIDQNKNVFFCKDIYNMDKSIIDQLQ
jgi:murein L,D-transpeptidase YcbB/YkuD